MTLGIEGPARQVAPVDHARQGQDERAMGQAMGALRASIYKAPARP
jgi:hypothetical protein